MKIVLHRSYTKAFVKRVSSNPRLVQRVIERIRLFQFNQQDPVLKDHALSGAKSGLRSFWVTGNIRIVYRPQTDSVIFVDIGTHNQVY